MSQKILIVGAGFAGVWGALGAARVLDAAGSAARDIDITLVSPRPELQVRPRLYESEPRKMIAPKRLRQAIRSLRSDSALLRQGPAREFTAGRPRIVMDDRMPYAPSEQT
jgi:NADH dehydrogenase FAD-containing subunit